MIESEQYIRERENAEFSNSINPAREEVKERPMNVFEKSIQGSLIVLKVNVSSTDVINAATLANHEWTRTLQTLQTAIQTRMDSQLFRELEELRKIEPTDHRYEQAQKTITDRLIADVEE